MTHWNKKGISWSSFLWTRHGSQVRHRAHARSVPCPTGQRNRKTSSIILNTCECRMSQDFLLLWHHQIINLYRFLLKKLNQKQQPLSVPALVFITLPSEPSSVQLSHTQTHELQTTMQRCIDKSFLYDNTLKL